MVRAHLDLRIDRADAMRAMLVATLVELLRERHHTPTPPSAPREASVGPIGGVNLACTWLQRDNLQGLDLASADLWRGDLGDARLDGHR